MSSFRSSTRNIAFQVEFTDEAIGDIQCHFEYIRADAPLNAAKWRKELEQKLHLLTFMADRFGVAKESRYAPGKLQELFFGNFRILYTVREPLTVGIHFTQTPDRRW